MMNFEESVRKSKRETPVFMACHGNSVNNTTQYRQTFFETLRCICGHCQNFISIELAIQELVGGFAQPPLGQDVGQKHLSRARVKISHCH